MMTAGEYVSAFVSIVLALAITDLATSVHRLIRARKRVRWDWLPLAAATLILVLTLQGWFVYFQFWAQRTELNFAQFLPFFAALMMIFFCASAALPDEVPADGMDLGAYYFENRAYFWGSFIILLASATAARATIGTPLMELVDWLLLPNGNLVLAVISAALIATKRRWVHVILVPGVIILLLWEWLALTLSS